MFGCHYNPARRPRTATACLARLCVALAALVPLGSVWSVPRATAQTRPNIVLVLTDDLDRAITTARPPVMPNLTQLIGDAGATFSRAYVNFPLCAPSRGTILTGRYAHNTRLI